MGMHEEKSCCALQKLLNNCVFEEIYQKEVPRDKFYEIMKMKRVEKEENGLLCV